VKSFGKLNVSQRRETEACHRRRSRRRFARYDI